MEKLIYNVSDVVVEFPEIRTHRYNKDFYYGFYCTEMKEQAIRWATRHNETGILNVYKYNPVESLNIKVFPEMTEEWLDFIVACRSGKSHAFDIVEGPMADDTIFNYVQNYIDGSISREAFWALAKFKHPTHQISFHTVSALATLEFVEGIEVKNE